MTNEEIEFIKETLVTAIDWAEYADDYFKQKHYLDGDKKDIQKCIEILNKQKESNEQNINYKS